MKTQLIIIKCGCILMNKFEDYIKYRALAFRFGNKLGDRYLDSLPERDLSDQEKNFLLEKRVSLPVFKNVCASLPLDLVERLERTLEILDVRKRDFVELSVIRALDQSDEILKEVGIYDALGELYISEESTS